MPCDVPPDFELRLYHGYPPPSFSLACASWPIDEATELGPEGVTYVEGNDQPGVDIFMAIYVVELLPYDDYWGECGWTAEWLDPLRFHPSGPIPTEPSRNTTCLITVDSIDRVTTGSIFLDVRDASLATVEVAEFPIQVVDRVPGWAPSSEPIGVRVGEEAVWTGVIDTAGADSPIGFAFEADTPATLEFDITDFGYRLWWTPGDADVGSHEFAMTLSDDDGNEVVVPFEVDVVAVESCGGCTTRRGQADWLAVAVMALVRRRRGA